MDIDHETRQEPKAKRARWLRRGVIAATAAAVLLPAATVLAGHLRTDVTPAHPFAANIDAAIQAGIGTEDVSGDPGLQFGPGLFQNRGRAAQWAHLGLGRVELGSGNVAALNDVVLTSAFQDLALAQIQVGGATGGTQFVLLVAAVNLYTTDTFTGCPCGAELRIIRDGGPTSAPFYGQVSVPPPAGSLFSDDSATAIWVFAVPSGTTQTFRFQARRYQGTGALHAFNGTVAAINAAFGPTGGNTLPAGLDAAPALNKAD